MSITQCILCNKIFKKTYSDLCDNCLPQESLILNKIDRYVLSSEDGCFTLKSISENLSIKLNVVQYLYKKGYLNEIIHRLFVNCKKCDAEFHSDNHKLEFCESCRADSYVDAYKEKDLLNTQNVLNQLDQVLKSKKYKNNSINKYGFKKPN